jgi:hypothetical protein
MYRGPTKEDEKEDAIIPPRVAERAHVLVEDDNERHA